MFQECYKVEYATPSLAIDDVPQSLWWHISNVSLCCYMFQLLPPPITESDAKRGILSLMERGLIPPAAELTLEPSPVRHRTAPIHHPSEKEGPRVPPPMVGGL